MRKSTSESSESELITTAALPGFFLSLLPLPVTCVLYTDFALGFTALDATGIHVGKCADLDLILGLPALDVDACGPICHKTLYNLSKFCFVATSKILKVDH